MHVLLVWIVYATAVLHCTQISVAQPDGNGCDIEGAVRLVGGTSELEGQVEVCTPDMIWSAVCGEVFSLNEARVICKMLGYSQMNATAYPEPRLHHQRLNISCGEDDMTLDDCDLSSECFNSQIGRVQCQPREPVCEDGDARLVGGQLNTEGLLEICVGETWNTVYWCDYWNSSEASASVVCRQMNYSRFGASASSEPSNKDTSPGHPLKCVGTEYKLSECSISLDQSCDVSDRVRVHCQPYCALCNTTATTRPSSFNCDAVGGTLGTLVIVLVFLLVGVTASLVYFTVKPKCNGREEHQPTKPEEDLDVPDERILHNPVYGCGSEALSPHNRKIDTVIPSQYSCVGPENAGVTISQSGKVHYIK